MKKLRLFLAVVVLATLTITNVHARAVGDFITDANDGRNTYSIISLEPGNFKVQVAKVGMSGAVVIPGIVKDSTGVEYKVTRLSEYGGVMNWQYAANITSLTLPETLEEILGAACNGLTNLTTVNLPKSLKSYGVRQEYGKFKELAIGAYAFLNCSKLTTVNIPDGGAYKSVNNILYSADGDTLFLYPNGKTATSFTVPSGVKVIATGAFATNRVLTSVSLPATCNQVLCMAFFACYNLTTINAPGNTALKSINGVLYNYNADTLITYPMGKTETTFTMPATVKHVKAFSCHGNIAVQHIVMPGVETLGNECFTSCSSLRDITIYPAFKDVDQSILLRCYSFQRWILNGECPYVAVDGKYVLYSKDYTKLLSAPSSLTGSYSTHPNTRLIYATAFRNAQIKQLTITKDVEEIGYYAFGSCILENVTFEEPSKLKIIAQNAFCHNFYLPSITIPASVETIGIGAFYNNTILKTVNLKDGSKLDTLGRLAFQSCPQLTTFRFLGTHTADSFIIDAQAFQHCALLASASGGVFDIPKATTTIGESAFNGCTSLRQVRFAADAVLDTIGFAAFQNCGLTSVEIPRSVRFLGNEAFNSCQQLKTVTIPAATTYVGPQAFLFCGQLRDILVDKGNPNYSSVNGMLASKDKETLYAFPAGKAATYYTMLSPSFTAIHDSAFYYCRGLKSVTIPKRVTKIGEHAFAICNSLERINFLADTPVTDVHDEAFIDMRRNSLLKNIDVYVRQGRRAAYEGSSFWGRDGSGSLKVKSIGESFVIEDDDAGQKAEYFPLSPTDASLIDVHSDVHTFVVPPSVTGGGRTYDVRLIGDYAFEDCTKDIEEVVVPGSIALNYIGARAFIKKDTNLKPVKSVFIVNATPAGLATSIFGLHDPGVTDNYDEVESGQTIYVKKAATADYKAAWPTMAGQIDYKIPGINLTKTYGTFAREFDVDLADYFAEYGAGKVYAFTSAPDQTIYEGSGDGSVPGTWYIRMRSVNEDLNGDGIYVPANTGVLLKSMDGAATPTGSAANGAFYYTIGDSTTVNTAVSSVLVGVTVRSREVKDPNKDIYVMSGGVFKPLAGQTVSDFPVHKAYLQLPGSQYPGSGGAKIVFLFDGEPTEIDAFGMDGGLKMDGDGPVYDLQGRRVTAPRKGIYVRNGKKIVIK